MLTRKAFLCGTIQGLQDAHPAGQTSMLRETCSIWQRLRPFGNNFRVFWVVTNRIGATLVVIAGFFQESVAGYKSPGQ